jgi:hypothetical protein
MTQDFQVISNLVREASPGMTPLQRMRGLQAVVARREAGLRKRRVLVIASALSCFGVLTAGAIGLVVLRGTHLGVMTGMMSQESISKESTGATGSPPASTTLRVPRGATTAAAADGDPLAYSVDNGEIGAGGYLRSFAGAAVSLRFAEKSELRLAAGSRGRLTSVDDRGARFAIEQGEAHVSVTPRSGARWLIDAGPFLITVHGTVFTAAWDGATERLDIKMQNGLVSVTGPVADGTIVVRGGQRLTVNVQNREVLLRPNQDASPNGDMQIEPLAQPALQPSGQPVMNPVMDPVMAPPRSRPLRPSARGESARLRASIAPSRSWAVELASGDFEGILREADHHGLQRSLADARSEDLAALADAARYLRQEDTARQALIAQRDRFPRSERAHQAAFLLGRLSESGTDGDARALAWYDLYLSEAPAGAYASEALGRKMTATEKLRGLSGARAIAREYLQRFPGGTYAGAARAIADAP